MAEDEMKSGLGVDHPLKPWNNVAIGAGATCNVIWCRGYARKSIYFLTNTDGNITIAVDPTGGGDWVTIVQDNAIGVRAAANPYTRLIEYGFTYMRVTFSAAATVTLMVDRSSP